MNIWERKKMNDKNIDDSIQCKYLTGHSWLYIHNRYAVVRGCQVTTNMNEL